MSNQPPRRRTASERRAARKNEKPGITNPYTILSAAERRDRERLKTGRVGTRESSTTMTAEQVAELLANPTREVTVDDLKRDYQHVIRDTRGMFMLAGGLVILEIVLALLLPR
jgi:hypothetical protein